MMGRGRFSGDFLSSFYILDKVKCNKIKNSLMVMMEVWGSSVIGKESEEDDSLVPHKCLRQIASVFWVRRFNIN